MEAGAETTLATVVTFVTVWITSSALLTVLALPELDRRLHRGALRIVVAGAADTVSGRTESNL